MISQHLLLTGCQRRIISTRGSTFSPNKFPPKSIVHGKVAPAIYELEKEVTKVKDARGTRELEGVSQVMNSSWVA